MTSFDNITLTDSDQQAFRGWLRLDLHSISWGGENLNDFEKLWMNLFTPETSLKDQVHKINFSRSIVKKGPLYSWINWIEEHLLIYVFLAKDISMVDLSNVFSLKPSQIIIILRNFIFSQYPGRESSFQYIFVVDKYDNEIKKMNSLSFFNDELLFDSVKEIKNNPAAIDQVFPLKNYLMQTFEVTIYKDFKKLLDLFFTKKIPILSFQKENDSFFYNFFRYFKIISKDFVLIGLSLMLIIFGVKYFTIWYDKFLFSKISIFEPTFFWLDKDLSYKDEKLNDLSDLNLDFSELDRLEKIEAESDDATKIAQALFEEESDVVLTSISDIPQSFEQASSEISDYEENAQGGYRNYTHGKSKAYRILINSSNTIELRKELASLIDKYKLKQIDNVKPGTVIPGGLYYNVLVKNTSLRKLLEDINGIENVTILENQMKVNEYPNMNKIFIWVKKI